MAIERRLFLMAGGVTCASLLLTPAAHAARVASIGELKPGDFIWRPDLSPEGPVVVIVSLPEQLTHVYRNGVEIAVSTCSTGKKGHSTPTGVFTILQKRKEHYSSTYNNAPMPNMQRLTWRGIALHAGNLPGYPASHGCVRLPKEFSTLLFGVTHYGTPVIIADRKTSGGMLDTPGLLLPDSARALASKAVGEAEKLPVDWTDSAEGDIASILVSGKDRMLYVMRSGQVEFQTAITVKQPDQPLGTKVYALMGPVPGQSHLEWLVFGMEPGIVTRETDETLGRIEIVDQAGARDVAATLRSGTTLVITDFAASPETRTGPDFVVVTEDEENS